MRQMLGAKKLAKLRQKTGLAIVAASVRGSTEHRINLYLEDGTITYLHADGVLVHTDHTHGFKSKAER